MARTAGKPRGHTPPPRATRKPLPPPQGPYTRFTQCVADFHAALGRCGGVDDLTPYQDMALSDLIGGLDERAVARVHQWWNYDLDALRAPGGWEGPKPRIALTVELTKRGNLAVEWTPDGYPKTDWASWHRLPSYAGHRPSNELLFIREFRRLSNLATDSGDRRGEFICSVNEHLLAMTAAAIAGLVARLEHSFRPRMVTKLELEWEPEQRTTWPLPGRHVLDWSIVDVAEQAHQAERAELEELLRRTGRDAEGFVRLLAEALPGLDPGELQEWKTRPKLRAALRPHGVELTPKPLARLIELLERHQPLVLARLRRMNRSASPTV